MKTLQRTNRFYIGMTLVFIALAALVIVAMRGVFGAISRAGEVDESLLGSSTPRLDMIKIDEALDSTRNREFTPLDL